MPNTKFMIFIIIIFNELLFDFDRVSNSHKSREHSLNQLKGSLYKSETSHSKTSCACAMVGNMFLDCSMCTLRQMGTRLSVKRQSRDATVPSCGKCQKITNTN